MTIIFLDEAGFTGEDLINEAQPFFVLASLKLDEQTCQALKQHFFGRVQARELKHSTLSRYGRQQQMVISFLNYLKDNQDVVKISVMDKKFALVCKIVDLIIEPLFYEHGIDLYNKGINIALSNLLFHTLPVFGGTTFFLNLLTSFQEMIRSRSKEAYHAFFSLVFQEYEHEDLNQELNYLRAAHHQFGYDILDIPENALDAALSLALRMMATWRAEISGPITLIHDASSNMSREKHLWDALMDPNLSPATVGYDRRVMTFPIAVETTIFKRSEGWAGLQLADIIAGATARAARWLDKDQDINDEYGRDLASVISEIPVLPVLPGTGVTPDELGTTDENAGDLFKYTRDILRKVKSNSPT